MRTFQLKFFSSFLLLITVLGCAQHTIIVLDPATIYNPTRGYFEWVSTTTRAGKLTPQSVGYTKQLVSDVDPNVKGQFAINYLAFYKNSEFQQRYNETYNQTYIPDYTNNTIIVNYDNVGSLKWYVNYNSDTIQISEFLNPYTVKADTVRSTYRRNSGLRGFLKLPIN